MGNNWKHVFYAAKRKRQLTVPVVVVVVVVASEILWFRCQKIIISQYSQFLSDVRGSRSTFLENWKKNTWFRIEIASLIRCSVAAVLRGIMSAKHIECGLAGWSAWPPQPLQNLRLHCELLLSLNVFFCPYIQHLAHLELLVFSNR
jgi:hypothetical protein